MQIRDRDKFKLKPFVILDIRSLLDNGFYSVIF